MTLPPTRRRIHQRFWDNTLIFLEAVLFNATLKLVALRLLLLAVIVNLGIQFESLSEVQIPEDAPQYASLSVVLPLGFIMIHNVGWYELLSEYQ